MNHHLGWSGEVALNCPATVHMERAWEALAVRPGTAGKEQELSSGDGLEHLGFRI